MHTHTYIYIECHAGTYWHKFMSYMNLCIVYIVNDIIQYYIYYI